jgi:hypothetical protein
MSKLGRKRSDVGESVSQSGCINTQLVCPTRESHLKYLAELIYQKPAYRENETLPCERRRPDQGVHDCKSNVSQQSGSKDRIVAPKQMSVTGFHQRDPVERNEAYTWWFFNEKAKGAQSRCREKTKQHKRTDMTNVQNQKSFEFDLPSHRRDETCRRRPPAGRDELKPPARTLATVTSVLSAPPPCAMSRMWTASGRGGESTSSVLDELNSLSRNFRASSTSHEISQVKSLEQLGSPRSTPSPRFPPFTMLARTDLRHRVSFTFHASHIFIANLCTVNMHPACNSRIQ